MPSELIVARCEESAENEKCDCSIYKKLTGKCYCLKHPEYNDFVIFFNENTKYSTNDTGEIIKNIRTLKKFLYMNDTYTKRALMFLNDALSQSNHKEQVEIIQGCSYADICNIFEEYTIVPFCMSWPSRFPNYSDCVIQVQSASLLLKIAKFAEGRKYLNLNSQLVSDIERIMKKPAHLETKTIENLREAMNLLKQSNKSLDFCLATEISQEKCNIKKKTIMINRPQMINRAQNTCTIKRLNIIPTFTE